MKMLAQTEAANEGIEAIFLFQTGGICHRKTELMGLMLLGSVAGAQEEGAVLDQEVGRLREGTTGEVRPIVLSSHLPRVVDRVGQTS